MDRKVTRVFTGPDGQSHLEDVDFPMTSKGPTRRESKTTTATGVYFMEFGPTY